MADMRIECANKLRENILFIMKSRKKTPKELADYMGVAERTVQRKLEDPQKFGTDELITLGRFLRCDPALFWCGEFTVKVPKIPVGL